MGLARHAEDPLAAGGVLDSALPPPPPACRTRPCRQEGEWPTYGNDDDRVDSIARDLVAGEGRLPRLRVPPDTVRSCSGLASEGA